MIKLKNIIYKKLELNIKLKKRQFTNGSRKKLKNQNNKEQMGKIKYTKLKLKTNKTFIKWSKIKIKNQNNKDWN